jgi:hypothetical protein
LFAKRRQSIIEKFNKDDIIKISTDANFFGQESKGLRQIRGNGVLILTSYELYYEMWVPKNRICRFPLKNIIEIETTKWHLKKSKNRLLLKVIFTNDKGERDSGAWLVRNLDDWIHTIENLRLKK